MASWDKRPDESVLAYQAFREYLLMPPPKSSRKAFNIVTGQNLKYPVSTSGQRWCATYKWRERVADYENVKTEMVVNSVLDSMVSHQNEVILASLTDYNIMLKDFQDWYKNNKSEFDADDFGKAITARLRIDDMGRRTVGLNNRIGAGNSQKKNEKPDLSRKSLSWGGMTIEEDDEGEPTE